MKIRILLLVFAILFTTFFPFFSVEAATAPTYNTSIRGTKDYNSYKVTNTGDMKIYYDKEEGVSYEYSENFKLYKIIDYYYNPTTKTIVYQFTTKFKDFLSSSFSGVSGHFTEEEYMSLDNGMAYKGPFTRDDYFEQHNVVFEDHYIYSSSEFSELMSKYAAYIRKNNISSDTDLDGNLYHGYSSGYNINVGSYLVLPSKTNYVYGVMADTIKVSSDGYVTDSAIYAKVSKTNVTSNINELTSTSFSIGDSFILKVRVNIPYYPKTATNSNRVFKLNINFNYTGIDSDPDTRLYRMSYKNQYWQDTTATGIDAEYGNFEVNLYGSGNNVVATAHRYQHGFYINVLDPSELMMGGNTVNFEIPCIANHLSILGGEGNLITTNVEFSEPYSDKTFITTRDSKVTIFSYGLQITGNAGAKFEVKNGSKVVGNVTIRSDGTGSLHGIKQGDYTVKQTLAPSGYVLLTRTETVKVGPGGTQVSGKQGYYNVTMMNTIPAVLPFTGSVGNMLFTLFGFLMMITAIIFIIFYKKHHKEKMINA